MYFLLEFQCLQCTRVGMTGWLGQNLENGSHNNYKRANIFFPKVYQIVEFGSSWNRVLLSVLCTEFVYIIIENIIGFKLQASEFMNHEIV